MQLRYTAILMFYKFSSYGCRGLTPDSNCNFCSTSENFDIAASRKSGDAVFKYSDIYQKRERCKSYHGETRSCTFVQNDKILFQCLSPWFYKSLA